MKKASYLLLAGVLVTFQACSSTAPKLNISEPSCRAALRAQLTDLLTAGGSHRVGHEQHRDAEAAAARAVADLESERGRRRVLTVAGPSGFSYTFRVVPQNRSCVLTLEKVRRPRPAVNVYDKEVALPEFATTVPLDGCICGE